VSSEEEFKAHVQDAFFDYDTYDIRSDAQTCFRATPPGWVAHPISSIVIGGYCDERGSN
jgi:peptidoglycan-associated lipoprotein